MAKKKKKKSLIRKVLETAGKAALLGGAAYGATKIFGGRKGNVSATAAMEDANLPDRSFSTARRLMTQPLAHNKRAPIYQDDIMRGGTGMTPDKTDRPWWKFKKGGRVTGIAKRGFGRALMKGKK